MTPSNGLGRDPKLRPLRRLLQAVQAGLYWTGIDKNYARRQNRPVPTILMYHSVCAPEYASWIAPRNRLEPSLFEEQMRFLARHRHVVDMEALLDMLSSGARIAAGTVAITFDDGYLDNLLVAAPILARYDLPATLYLATGYVGRGENQWSDVLYASIVHRTRNALGPAAGSHSLDTAHGCEGAYRAIGEQLLVSEYPRRTRILNEVMESLRPADPAPRLTLTWDDVRTLVRQYPRIELGVHTADHVDLTAMPIESAVAEMSRCVEDFRRELGRRPLHFSFPYSRAHSTLYKRLPDLGLISAMTSAQGIETTDSINPLNLGRLESPGSMGLLGHWTSGAYPRLSRQLFGRA